MEKTTDVVREDIIEDEVFHIIKAGELPEVAYHSTLYHLSGDPEGPGIVPVQEEVNKFKWAVVECYKNIIFRDITPENRQKRRYRGLQRASINLNRLLRFINKESMVIGDLLEEISMKTLFFLQNEIKECSEGKASSINCSYETLKKFTEKLKISHLIPPDIKELCPNER